MTSSFAVTPSLEECRAVLAAARTAGLVGPATPAVVFHDLDLLGRRIAELRAVFPERTLHAVAIKANPVVGILRTAVAAGAGLEAASLEEVHLALAAGCPPDRIVYDSPAKSEADLRTSLELGVRINADNLDEVERLSRLVGALPAGTSASVVGVRVNPEVGDAAIATTSVGGAGSRFGVRAATGSTLLPDLFAAHPFLRGLHVHVGSQGTSLALLCEAAAVVDDLRAQIDARCGQGRVASVDIGGGLPTRYTSESPPTPQEYVAALRDRAPRLLADPGVELVTEFGRAVHAGCGWAVSRVEYVKDAGGPVAVIHLGADFLMRPAYQPTTWLHRFSALEPAAGEVRPWTIAGPLCFAGDIVGRGVPLPPLAPGDRLVIHDVGAYTMSMWSRHCSRGMPPVVGYRAGGAEVTLLKAAETPSDVVRLWGG